MGLVYAKTWLTPGLLPLLLFLCVAQSLGHPTLVHLVPGYQSYSYTYFHRQFDPFKWEVSQTHPIVLSPLCVELLNRLWVFGQRVPNLYCPVQVPVRLRPPIQTGSSATSHSWSHADYGNYEFGLGTLQLPSQPKRQVLSQNEVINIDYDSSSNSKCPLRLLEANSCVQRPLLYYRGDNLCYFAYSQGPCQENEWLVPQSGLGNKRSTVGVCESNVCLGSSPPLSSDSIVEDLSSPIFQFVYQGQCYRTNTTAFCQTGQVVYFDLPVGDVLSPLCGPSLRFSSECLPSNVPKVTFSEDPSTQNDEEQALANFNCADDQTDSKQGCGSSSKSKRTQEIATLTESDSDEIMEFSH